MGRPEGRKEEGEGRNDSWYSGLPNRGRGEERLRRSPRDEQEGVQSRESEMRGWVEERSVLGIRVQKLGALSRQRTEPGKWDRGQV